MARRPRRDAPGSWHHVSNRALSSRTLFERRADLRYFLSRLARAVRREQIRLHAFCLLMTHFHLLVESRSGGLDRAMARIQCEYSLYFNRTRGRDGPLFRGRYWSGRADCGFYRHNVVRYIDANAVKAGIALRPEWHPASSAYWYCHGGASPRWLSRDWVERQVIGDSGRPRFRVDDYREVFRPSLEPDFEAWIELRLARGDFGPDPLADLIHAVPAKVLGWMIRRADVADGSRIGIPLLPASVLEHACDVHEGDFRALDSARGTTCAVRTPRISIARAGLLADVAGLTQHAISARMRLSPSACQMRVRRHRDLLRQEGGYANLAAAVVHLALHRIE